ncbi:hypothetical protein NDK43_17910 [Neobacillus pocheonensis]|uniref:Uncharacterized protein n=1 Tax=Neobacillus pocheonensis TaxID=363869 RepID=A0ABT0WC52_9BACI|nr:hypothetical protein [Neobacillus pocheonensis]
MSKFGMYVKFTAQSGKRDELTAVLLDAAASMENVHDYEIYLVNISDTEPRYSLGNRSLVQCGCPPKIAHFRGNEGNHSESKTANCRD